ncbi:unnamed protein product [Rhodiola kirilowii]
MLAPLLETPSCQSLQPLVGCNMLACSLDPDPHPDMLISSLGTELSGVICRSVFDDDGKDIWSEDAKAEVCVDSSAIGSCRNSFSGAHEEWQEKNLGSNAFLHRPASLDFNSNMMASSPKNGALSKGTIYSHRSGTFPSPGELNYRHGSSVGFQKGWSSERVPLARNGNNRRQVSSTMLPYSYGRTLPSKWEDAERWIFSPVSADGFVRSTGVPKVHRQHKSISGPISIGPPGIAYYSLYSPCISVPGGTMGNRLAGTAFSAGVIATDGLGFDYSCHGRNHSDRTEAYMTRSASVHGCSRDVSNTVDEKAPVGQDASNVSRDVSRRDFATQMSPEGSTESSPRKRPSTSTLSIVESRSYQSSQSDVKDVEVDERVTITRLSKKNKVRKSRARSPNVDAWSKKAIVSQSCPWEVSETGKSIARFNREEARITAWENLQKAKADAAMRRLEVKLEKKRSSSMDKIMNKLRSAQRRAQDMRSSVLANQAQNELSTMTSQKAILSHKGKTHQVRSLSGCFTCHAF